MLERFLSDGFFSSSHVRRPDGLHTWAVQPTYVGSRARNRGTKKTCFPTQKKIRWSPNF